MAVACYPKKQLLLQPPELTQKMMKTLRVFMKPHAKGAVAALEDRFSELIEHNLKSEYGLSFHDEARSAPSSEYSRIPAEVLLQAVQDLKSGKREPEIMRRSFVVAYRLMERGSPTCNVQQRADEAEFKIAQAILLQIANTVLLDQANFDGSVVLDNHRMVRLCPWGHHLLALPVYLEAGLKSRSIVPTEVTEPIELVICPKPDGSWYKSRLSMMTVCIKDETGMQEVLCEGAHVIMSFVHPHIDIMQASGNKKSNPQEVADVNLRWFIPCPSAKDIQKYLDAACRKEPVVFLRRNLGLTHPDLPFHESCNVVFLDDMRDVEQVLKLADQVPCGLKSVCTDFQHGVVPFTFPPALDDWDASIQSCLLAVGAPFENVESAMHYFQDKLEEQHVSLSEIETVVIEEIKVNDADDMIANAKRLARDALLCLQSHHVAVGWVSELLTEIADSAAYQIRIKREQEEVSKRWNMPPPSKNRHAAKRDRRKGEHMELKAEPRPESAVHRLRAILRNFNNKVFKYQHYVKAFNALRSTGLLDHIKSEQIHGSHHVLHASGANSVTIARPHGCSAEHGRHRFVRSLMNIAVSAPKAWM